MDYATLKIFHLSCAALSYALFFLRGVWMLRNSSILNTKLVRILPHVVDTLLLGSALTLAYLASLNPLTTPWLLAKLIALLVYIALGTIALKRGKTHRIRLLAWISAQMVFGYIVLTAIHHNFIPWQ